MQMHGARNRPCLSESANLRVLIGPGLAVRASRYLHRPLVAIRTHLGKSLRTMPIGEGKPLVEGTIEVTQSER